MIFHRRLTQTMRGAVVKRCARGDCRLDLGGAANPVTVLDCDEQPVRDLFPGSVCDFLVFVCECPLTIVPVEMKGKAWDPKEAAAQLCAGAQVTEDLAKSQGVDRFLPLLLTAGVKSPNQLKVLGQCRVTFRGRRYAIVQRRCGAALKDLPC